MNANLGKFTDKASEDILMTEIEETLKADKNGSKLREYLDRIGSSKRAVEKQLAKGCTPDKKVVLEKLKQAWAGADTVVRQMYERLTS